MHTTKTRLKDLEKRKARRAEWLQSHGPCSCGSWKDLQVDHINPATKLSHTVWSWSTTKRQAELDKCQVLCKTCHKNKTSTENAQRFLQPIQHGSRTGYTYKGCRCRECVEGYSKLRKTDPSRQRAKVATRAPNPK